MAPQLNQDEQRRLELELALLDMELELLLTDQGYSPEDEYWLEVMGPSNTRRALKEWDEDRRERRKERLARLRFAAVTPTSPSEVAA
jgi:hypothetical protein